MKEVVVEVPVYKTRVVVFIGKPDIQQYVERVAAHCFEWRGIKNIEWDGCPEEAFSGARGFCSDAGLLQFIWLDRKDIDVLVHEVTHATLYLGNTLGFVDILECSEFYCYMNGYLVKEVRASW